MKKLVVVTIGAVVAAGTVYVFKKANAIIKKSEAEALAMVNNINFDEMFKELDKELDKELKEMKERNSVRLTELAKRREELLRTYEATTNKESINKKDIEQMNKDLDKLLH